jgi:hypothetical protein
MPKSIPICLLIFQLSQPSINLESGTINATNVQWLASLLTNGQNIAIKQGIIVALVQYKVSWCVSVKLMTILITECYGLIFKRARPYALASHVVMREFAGHQTIFKSYLIFVDT